MDHGIKNQEAILEKLNISALNPMQEEALSVIKANTNTVILSPTGTGKTLAFLLPLLQLLDAKSSEIQALVIVPSRELAIQIEQVVRAMGSGYKVNAVYGGRPMSKDKIELKHNPAILIGTPGRLLDHFDNDRFSKASIKTLILDEFDKSLEQGFEEEMKAILYCLTGLSNRILTSATQAVAIPEFVNFNRPTRIDYLKNTTVSRLALKLVLSPEKNKLVTLVDLLKHIGSAPGIIFCNFRESIDKVSAVLEKHHIGHACFSGGMEQKDRERALIKFRNGTCELLVATDLAARGIDIPEMKFIIHYELPIHKEEFIHRNGRTARVHAAGTAYLIKWKDQLLPDFITSTDPIDISSRAAYKKQYWETLFISGGRKDKISKGDIAGLFLKKGGLKKEELGAIELKPDCAFVAVPLALTNQLISALNNSRLKKKKVRITVLQ
jgi:superfamily II DNA/RNA helicase